MRAHFALCSRLGHASLALIVLRSILFVFQCDHITPFPGPRSIVLLDNASIHRSVRFVEAVNACGGMVLFLPPYCWDLSPLDNNAFGSKRKLVWLDGRAEERMYVRRPHNSGRGVGSADAAARQSMWSDSSGMHDTLHAFSFG